MTNNVYEIIIPNMGCQVCYGRIQKLFNQLDVQIVNLNLSSKTDQISFNPNRMSQTEIENQLNKIGYQIEWK